jgi:6,7-dimethyl-8-ribityllumazine synthase
MATQPTEFLANDFASLGKKKLAIFFTTWNKNINAALLEGAKEILASYPQIEIVEYEVPGSVELGYAIKQLSEHKPADAYIAFGCVIRGGTPHFDYVCEAANQSVVELNLTLPSPVIFGVLTLENEEQAWERLGGSHGHKGKEAAQTALAMMVFKDELRESF